MGTRANASLASAGSQVTPQQLHDMLKQANQRISELESRLQALERAVYVSPSGDVEICSATQVRIIAGVRVDIQGDHSVDISASQRMQLRDQNGNSIQLGSSGITNTAAAQHRTNASTIEASAGMVTVSAGMSKYSGVVKCDTMIANSVVGSSYTPGAGNMM